MKKVMITVLNILSALPIIIYPILLATSIMVFAVPGVTKSVTGLVTGFSMLLFPIVIVVGIILSRKYNSVAWAVFACIPLIVFVGVLIKNTISNRNVNMHSDLYNRTHDLSADSNVTNSKLLGVWVTTPGSENGAILGQEKIEFTDVNGIKMFKNIYDDGKIIETYPWSVDAKGDGIIIKEKTGDQHYSIHLNPDTGVMAVNYIFENIPPVGEYATGYYTKVK